MKKSRLIPLLAIFCMLFASCEKAFLKDDVKSSPVNNFEIFWEDFDQHYGLFEARGWNWDSIYQVYRPQINNRTTDDQLWNTFKEMISYLDDSHAFVYNPEDDDFFASGSKEDDRVQDEFSLPLLKDAYLDNVVELDLSGDEDESYLFGKIKNKDIGYIYLSDIEADNENFIDDILKVIGGHKAIILDVRNNTGGTDKIAAAIAGRFTVEEKVIYTVQTRNGPNHNDFSAKNQYTSKVLGKEHFDKPVILLTDKITVSAAEILGFHMKSLEQITHIGDTTAGDFSDVSMRRFLPNGWQYQYSIMQYLLPDGKSLDGIGHIPDILIRNTVDNIKSDNDMVIQEAIDYLFTEYGIN